MFDRLHNLRTSHARRGAALVTALAVLAGAVGIPLPQYVAKDTSRPFPCMHHACGCLTAESCWRGCCCMSDEQKVAWARTNGVSLPGDFSSAPTAAGAKCCSSRQCESREEPAVDWRIVRIDASRKCQGLSSLWMILGQALPPPKAESFETDLTLVSWLTSSGAAQAEGPAFDPATPPPRMAL